MNSRIFLLIVSFFFAHCNARQNDLDEVSGFEAQANQEYDYSHRAIDVNFQHAPDSAREAWLDRKFGMRIHFGPYSQLGLDASWPTLGSSEEFKSIYSTLWQMFNPVNFDAMAYAQLAEDAGMKYFVFTAKHHDGFSMYDTDTRVNVKMRRPKGKVQGIGNVMDTVMHYSIMETPFKRDIVKELVEAFREKGMGIGLYYSNTDWNDSNQRFERKNFFYDSGYTLKAHPEGYRKAVERQTRQLQELCTKYGAIDQIDFDHGLPGDLWHETEKMIKMVRKLQPNALFRERGLGKYGDFETPEHWLPESSSDPRLTMLWQAIEHYGTRWAWQPNDSYQGKEWILETLIDCASKGGNFMVGVSPTPTGAFDEETQAALRWVGKWLKINGEAIYSTRGKFIDGNTYRFTRSKDETCLYAIIKGWPANNQAIIKNISLKSSASVYLLGHPAKLVWKQQGANLVIRLPRLRPPCEYAYVIKMKVK